MNRIASVGLFVIDTGVNIAMEIRKKCYAVCRLIFFFSLFFLAFFSFSFFYSITSLFWSSSVWCLTMKWGDRQQEW